MLKKELNLDDDTYRTVLWTVARVESAKDLDSYGRGRVIAHLSSLRRRNGSRNQGGVAEHKRKQVAKIRAVLINAAGGARPDAYADAMAQRMFQVERFTWCTPEQLHKLIGALMVDCKRHHQETPASG